MSVTTLIDRDRAEALPCTTMTGLSDVACEQLALNAQLENQGEQSIEASVQILRRIGWLAGAMPLHWNGAGMGFGGRHAWFSVRLLMDVAEVNLPLARLYEGHVNALWLLDAYGDLATRERSAELASNGALLGVWQANLTPVLYRAHAGIDLTVRAAAFCDTDQAWVEPERAVALSLFARLMSAEVAQSALQAVEQSLGLSHFNEQSSSGCIGRDLSTYIRQIAADAFVQRSGQFTMNSPDHLSRLFDPELNDQ